MHIGSIHKLEQERTIEDTSVSGLVCVFVCAFSKHIVESDPFNQNVVHYGNVTPKFVAAIPKYENIADFCSPLITGAFDGCLGRSAFTSERTQERAGGQEDKSETGVHRLL